MFPTGGLPLRPATFALSAANPDVLAAVRRMICIAQPWPTVWRQVVYHGPDRQVEVGRSDKLGRRFISHQRRCLDDVPAGPGRDAGAIVGEREAGAPAEAQAVQANERKQRAQFRSSEGGLDS
jgi:hypothetical protein